MNRLHTCPSNLHQTSFRLQTNNSIFKQRLQTEHTPSSKKNSNHLVQALKQNRRKHEKGHSKKKVLKGLLDFSLRKFKQERKSIPIFNNSNKGYIKEIRNSVQSTFLEPIHIRITTDMSQVQQLKNDILSNLKVFSFGKEKHTPLISQRKEEPKENKGDTQERLKEVKQLKEHIQRKIDTLGQMLDRVSMLMTSNKIQFRTTLFLFYKLFWIARVSLSRKITLLKQANQEQQLLKENRSIEQCLVAMIEKLKQSKKWKQYQPKYVFQQLDLNEQGKRQLVKTLLKHLVKDYAKLMKAMQYNEDNIQKLYQFGISFIFIAKEYLPQQSSKHITNVEKPQKKDVEQLLGLLIKIEKVFNE